ncbi:MAG: hypothetical protein ACLQJR_21990 [Stellaceae bacterium]
MGVIYVARSAKFGKWASDVGLSKHVYKVGYADADPKAIVEQGWGGESDWAILKKQEVEGLSEEEVIRRLARKEKMVDPAYYPRLRGATGVFKVLPEHVENHMIVSRTMAGEFDRAEIKLKPVDFADYLIHNALR